MAHPVLRRAGRTVALAALAAGALAPAASAQGPGPAMIGLEVKSVDAAARTVTGVQHCVAPDQAGTIATFKVDLQDFSPNQFPVGAVMGIEVRWDTPPAITRFGAPPCQIQRPAGQLQPGMPGPGGQQQPGMPGGHQQPGMPGPGGPGGAGGAGGQFMPGFLNRVWKFEGEANGYANGRLSITLSKILNLPKKMQMQDDELVDEDALVLVGAAVKVYDGSRLVPSRKEAGELADADRVRVQGKILPPAKWAEDEDGGKVTTVRAKRIYVLG